MDLHQQVFSVLFMGMNFATQVNLERKSYQMATTTTVSVSHAGGIQVSLWGNFRGHLYLTACAIKKVIDRI
jgi:hypothetical protein